MPFIKLNLLMHAGLWRPKLFHPIVRMIQILTKAWNVSIKMSVVQEE